MARIPSNNPWQNTGAICQQCGNPLQLEVDRTTKGIVNEVRVYCINPESNCGYYTVVSLQYLLGDGPKAFTSEELQKRRDQAKGFLDFNLQRDSSIKELIALLPRLKEVVKILSSSEESTASEAEPEKKKSEIAAGATKE